MNGYVTPEAHDGWHALAKKHGLNVSDLLEVIGRRLNAGRSTEVDDELVTEAREINEARRHAPRPRGPKKRS